MENCEADWWVHMGFITLFCLLLYIWKFLQNIFFYLYAQFNSCYERKKCFLKYKESINLPVQIH